MNIALRTRPLAITAVALVSIAAAAAVRFVRSNRTVPRPVPAGWIAFSTAPADEPETGGPSGSDVFLVRPGSRLRQVAGRGRDTDIWNLCPAFSPDGRQLAFGQRAPDGLTINVVGVAADGTIGPPHVTIPVPDANPFAPCPKWSADGTHLAYLNAAHKLRVRGLDGSRRPPAPGDPQVRAFDRSSNTVGAPAGDLVAHEGDSAGCGVSVSRPDGSGSSAINRDLCPYAVAGWSPDGQDVLVMVDGGTGFTMSAIAVERPYTLTPIAIDVPVNDPRSYPGLGDVSWQPTLRQGPSTP